MIKNDSDGEHYWRTTTTKGEKGGEGGRSRVSFLVRAPDSWSRQVAGEFTSPELTLCADSVSVPPPCYRSGTKKTPVILSKVQVAGYA